MVAAGRHNSIFWQLSYPEVFWGGGEYNTVDPQTFASGGDCQVQQFLRVQELCNGTHHLHGVFPPVQLHLGWSDSWRWSQLDQDTSHRLVIVTALCSSGSRIKCLLLICFRCGVKDTTEPFKLSFLFTVMELSLLSSYQCLWWHKSSKINTSFSKKGWTMKDKTRHWQQRLR